MSVTLSFKKSHHFQDCQWGQGRDQDIECCLQSFVLLMEKLLISDAQQGQQPHSPSKGTSKKSQRLTLKCLIVVGGLSPCGHKWFTFKSRKEAALESILYGVLSALSNSFNLHLQLLDLSSFWELFEVLVIQLSNDHELDIRLLNEHHSV